MALIGIVLALVSLVVWGVSDLVTTMSLARESKWKVLMVSQLFGALMIFIALLYLRQIPVITLEGVAWIVGLGIVNFIGMFTQYEAMKKKGIALTSPLVNSWGVIAVFLGIVFYGESITFIQAIGVVLLLAGIFAISVREGEKIVFDTHLIFAIISMAMWGIFFFVLKIPVLLLGALLVSMAVKFFTSVLCFPFLAAKKISIFDTLHKNLLLILFVGLLDSIGIVAYNFAIGFAPVSIVAPIVSSIPALAVVFGVLVLKERLSKRQVVGIIAAIAGIIALSLF